MNKRQLLTGLLAGKITGEEFRRCLSGPKFISCGIHHLDKKSPAESNIDPGDMVTASIDGKPRKMSFAEYQDLCGDNPGAVAMIPIVFIPQTKTR